MLLVKGGTLCVDGEKFVQIDDRSLGCVLKRAVDTRPPTALVFKGSPDGCLPGSNGERPPRARQSPRRIRRTAKKGLTAPRGVSNLRRFP